ncbi:hypothetical protein [Muribaculum intestinale]|uniref:Cbp1 family collagen-binding glycoprotein adhesin n=1 Tax=Muribaculum intestinale TaxID=1796646 RepID=UPI002431E7F5|nr:hypothetical protein [Muribaculum intestinale]
MKHITVILVLSAAIAACAPKEPTESRQDLMEASRQELATAVSERDMLFALVKEIAVDMEEMKRLENIISVTPVSAESDVREYSQLRNDMSALKRSLNQRRQRLAEVEEQLQQSGLFTDDLQDVIDIMRKQLDIQASEIKTLNTRLLKANSSIAELNTTIDSLNHSIDKANNQRDSIGRNAARFEEELYTCYYIVESKSALKDMHIIESGFLRPTRLTRDFDNSAFIAGDKRSLGALKMTSDKARLLSNHPDYSYEIIDNDNTKMLIIKDPENFWSHTNYLVIQTD